MSDLSPENEDSEGVPESFGQHNREKYQRTVRLTRLAIARLEEAKQEVALAAIAEATRAFDEGGKGITAATILRNPEARELFHQHSPAYQRRQAQTARARRKRRQQPVGADRRAEYRGLRASDLVQMVEDLKQVIAELEAQQARLRTERDEAYRLRDEILQQNTKQLAILTALQARIQ